MTEANEQKKEVSAEESCKDLPADSTQQDPVDEASEESFPASDPPASNAGHATPRPAKS
jgi:hypothetical protein